jgi:glucokinase
LNPQRIVIGGGVTNAGDLLFTPIEREVHIRAFPRASETLEIVHASLGDDGGLLGAGAYVTYRLDREPK